MYFCETFQYELSFDRDITHTSVEKNGFPVGIGIKIGSKIFLYQKHTRKWNLKYF